MKRLLSIFAPRARASCQISEPHCNRDFIRSSRCPAHAQLAEQRVGAMDIGFLSLCQDSCGEVMADLSDPCHLLLASLLNLCQSFRTM